MTGKASTIKSTKKRMVTPCYSARRRQHCWS
jgi:hypothetical protein